MRWTEGHIVAAQRPSRGRSAWHACGWVSREPGRPRCLHLKDRRGAGTGSPSPRPWTDLADGAKLQVPGSKGSAGGESECLIVPLKRGLRDPVEGRGHRQMDPGGRGWIVSIAELARDAPSRAWLKSVCSGAATRKHRLDGQTAAVRGASGGEPAVTARSLQVRPVCRASRPTSRKGSEPAGTRCCSGPSDVLESVYEPSGRSFGFRPGRSAHQASLGERW